jgi:polysaccharide biosynthesis/export protein
MNRDSDKLMMKKLPILLLLIASCASCVTHQELLNFSKGPAFPDSPVDITNLPQLRIQPDDLLSIRVRALEQETAEPYNLEPANMQLNMGMLGGGGMRPLIGYLVSSEGEIDFPGLGTLRVLGMTTDEVRALLVERLQPYLIEPVVTVRFLNFRITVLGEVTAPSTFFVAQERVTVLDMLGMAGDVTPYGNRTNVLVIREQDGQRSFGRINLQERDLFASPYFYLQQNDIVYVEPLPVRTASIRDQTQRILPWISVITALTTLGLTLGNLR